MATGYTYGGAEGAPNFFSFPLPTYHPSPPRRWSTPTLYLNPTLTLTPTPTLSLLLTLHLTLPMTLIKTEYWDQAGGGGNISYEW